ncbi:MAG: OPT/YSL family transporter [Bdellovibrionota bacterium]
MDSANSLPHTPVQPSDITPRSIALGSILAVMLCAMNSYLTLSFGVIEEGPTIAALFFFTFFFWSKKKISTTEMVIVSTMGSAGGSLGFISNFFAAKAMIGPAYTMTEMFLFALVSSMVGMAMVIPLRQLLILRENLPWPGAKATAGVINALVNEGDPKQARYLLMTFLIMLVVVIGNADQGFKWWQGEFAIPGLAAFGAAVLWSSPFSIGGSYLMGFRTCVGFLVGAILLMLLGYFGVAADESAPHKFYWPGLGFLVASGLTMIVINWRSMYEALLSLVSLKDAGKDDDDPIMSPKAFLALLTGSTLLAIFILHQFFSLTIPLIVILVAIGGLLQNIISTRAAAQTAFNPARVMGILLEGICTVFGAKSAPLNLAGAGFVAGSGAQAGVLTGDLAYGRWFHVPSRYQFWAQTLTIIPCCFVSAWVFSQINVAGALSLEGGKHAAPVAKMWAQSSLMFEKGLDSLPEGALLWLAIGALVGVIYTCLELVPAIEKWLPASVGIGLGMVLSVATGITFFIGGFIMWIILRRWLGFRDITLTTIAVGCIVAEGIGGVMKPGLIHLGIIAG